jgi:TATA-box binding protein (TBP) (component of TFIID and TFIIIB)
MYDHTTPFTFDEETGNFTISGAGKSNEIGTLSVDDVEITQITTETDLTEFVNDVKMSKLYCDNIETINVMEGGCNLSKISIVVSR